MATHNLPKLLHQRQIQSDSGYGYRRNLHVTDNLISRIGLEAELEGHSGCVNCIEWNAEGNLLLSGSDDVNIILWDPFRHKKLQTINSGHYGNIFSVKFLPYSSNEIIVSGAADSRIRTHNLKTGETTRVCSCHVGRVKRIATSPSVPHMYWSAAEDGLIMQFDERCPHKCTSTCSNILLNLLQLNGDNTEAKCLAINPTRPEMIAVGVNDPYVRMFDRRMIKLKKISYPSDFSQRTSWERIDLLRDATLKDISDSSMTPTCANYYVAGHLPLKLSDFKRKRRTVSCTYLTFSPDGTELLVNIGGEQVYLFSVTEPNYPKAFHTKHTSVLVADESTSKQGTSSSNGKIKCSNGHRNGTSNGVTANGINGTSLPSKSIPDKVLKDSSMNKKVKHDLPPLIEKMKLEANNAFEKELYTLAISLYNEALYRYPASPVLYSNRAAAYLKRQWDGDTYSAMNDCYEALKIDPHHIKAHFRLAKCLYELQKIQEAADCLKEFRNTFPEYGCNHAFKNLDLDINKTLTAEKEGLRIGRKRKVDPEVYTDYLKPGDDSTLLLMFDEDSDGLFNWSNASLYHYEKQWRKEAHDYKSRFCGHCNTTTDIKEANFFGSNGQYVIAGSDDGSFFIWEKRTTNIKRVLHGDESIVNCLQPHPTYCMLASSGIDVVVRLWSPLPEDGKKNDRVVNDLDTAATDNQKRMNADPLEMMLMNMGYRMSSSADSGDEVVNTDDNGELRCRTN